MVSEKVIVVLLIVAIVLSVVSVVVTLSTLDSELVPTELKVKGPTHDSVQGKVSVIIEPYQSGEEG